MSIKTKAGQLWTDSVAYVALLTGAGLSIAGNVADVRRVRAGKMDNLDVTMAVVFPALVVLMVEVFVSSRWRGLGWPMQILRWLGCGAVTAVAMRVSWVHLNELMLSRGQQSDVATLGPLAIDFLAIMATALILAGRGHERPAPTAVALSVATQPDADESAAITERPEAYPPNIADVAQSYLDRLGATLDSTTTAAHPISPAPTTNAVKPESVPDTATDLILAWHAADAVERPAATQVNEALAAWFDVSPRTGRRWVSALKTS